MGGQEKLNPKPGFTIPEELLPLCMDQKLSVASVIQKAITSTQRENRFQKFDSPSEWFMLLNKHYQKLYVDKSGEALAEFTRWRKLEEYVFTINSQYGWKAASDYIFGFFRAVHLKDHNWTTMGFYNALVHAAVVARHGGGKLSAQQSAQTPKTGGAAKSVATAVCHQWRDKGKCSFGGSCKYLSSHHSGSTESATPKTS